LPRLGPADYDEGGGMQIEPATCPACRAAFNPLRARAVTVIDGRVQAFCSAACRDRGPSVAPPPVPPGDAHVTTAPVRRWSPWPREQLVLAVAAMGALAVFVLLIRAGRHQRMAMTATAAAATRAPPPSEKPDVSLAAGDSDEWIQPLSGAPRHVARERRLFAGARAGVPASECAGGRCAVELEAAAGEMVMAVHDGVVEAVERDPDFAARRGQEGRLVRVNHKGGAVASIYMQLDGIRADLRPGVPVRMGEALGTVARGGGGARPHLRFAMTLNDAADGTVLFIDPQPLLTLWPTRKRAATSLHAMERAPRPPRVSHPPRATAASDDANKSDTSHKSDDSAGDDSDDSDGDDPH
jgi:hypothetical protein